MKKYLSILIIALLAISCTSQKEVTTDKSSTKVVSDTSGYDVLIIDPEFDRWYSMRFSQSMDRSDQYYSSMNDLAARNWNDYYHRGRYNRIIDSYLNYNPAIEYGIETNRKLYWYFKFVEERYGIRLLR